MVAALAEIVGPAHVLTDREVVAGHERDWTGRYVGRTGAVVRPADTAEVAGVLALARRTGLAVVPQGGNTGLVGGGIAFDGAITLAGTRLGGIEPIDQSGQLLAGAGVSLATSQAHAAAAGWLVPVDLAARESATLGGMVATNAGGLHVIRHGPMRANLVGVEAVTGSGAVVSDLRGLLKDNTGYHLPSLLCGSEGTLAMVTRVRLALVRPSSRTVVALLAFDTVAQAVRAAATLRGEVRDVSAIELVLASGVALVRRVVGLPAPFPREHGALLLVEAAGDDDVVDRLAAAVADTPDTRDVAVATDSLRAAALWRYREAHTEAIATLGPVHKLDVTLPATALADFVADIPSRITTRWPDASVWLFGHAGDGNVHVNVTGVAPDDDDVDDVVLRAVAERGGSISAEHGIGRAKRRWLHLNRSPEEIAVFRAIKAALDPDGILNPGVLLP